MPGGRQHYRASNIRSKVDRTVNQKTSNSHLVIENALGSLVPRPTFVIEFTLDGQYYYFQRNSKAYCLDDFLL